MPAPNIRARAIEFAKAVILRSTDWQEVQFALHNHPEFGPWLTGQDNDGTGVIRAAEERLGDRLPSGYSN